MIWRRYPEHWLLFLLLVTVTIGTKRGCVIALRIYVRFCSCIADGRARGAFLTIQIFVRVVFFMDTLRKRVHLLDDGRLIWSISTSRRDWFCTGFGFRFLLHITSLLVIIIINVTDRLYYMHDDLEMICILIRYLPISFLFVPSRYCTARPNILLGWHVTTSSKRHRFG
jgi:hypothetical protein